MPYATNQAEQIAVLKVLEKLEVQDGQDNDKRIAICTDSKITLDLLQNKFKRNSLIELIRNKIIAMAQYNSIENCLHMWQRQWTNTGRGQ